MLYCTCYPCGFILCRVDDVLTLLQNNLCGSNSVFFFLTHLVVMLCVYFRGGAVHLGLHTVHVMHRDRAAEDL